MTDYSCDEVHQIYKNETSATQHVRVTIMSSCGQECSVTVIDLNGDAVHDALLDSTGGAATMDIEPGNRLHVMCSGGQSSNMGCQVNLDFV